MIIFSKIFDFDAIFFCKFGIKHVSNILYIQGFGVKTHVYGPQNPYWSQKDQSFYSKYSIFFHEIRIYLIMTQYSLFTEYIWKKCVQNFEKIRKSEYSAFRRALSKSTFAPHSLVLLFTLLRNRS